MADFIQLILVGVLVVALVVLVLIVVRVIQLPSLRSLEVDVARLAATRAAGVALTARHELDTLVDLIMRQAIGLTGAEGGAVCLYEGSVLHLVAIHGLSPTM